MEYTASYRYFKDGTGSKNEINVKRKMGKIHEEIYNLFGDLFFFTLQ
jgi:hypothetical protein